MMRRTLIAASCAWILTGSEPAPAAPPGPDLGLPLAAAEQQALDSDIWPDGRGLPPGSGDVEQGERLYAERCLSCHGPGGQGDSADQLAGARMGLTDEWPEKTIGNFWPYAAVLFDFTRRTMPMDAPGSLDAGQVYALTAYLLYLNGIVDADTELDAAGLARIRMPNRDGFVPDGERPP